jgi:predicted GNAT family N-acyltransferase
MRFDEIQFGSIQYYQSVGIRYEVLRKPLNLHFQLNDFFQEPNEFHIGAFLENRVVGSLILSPQSNLILKMRQVAIDFSFQSKHIGSKLIRFSEKIAKEKGFQKIELNARKTAVEFYSKLDYSIESDEFLEVGIPHYKMSKSFLS